MCKFNRDRITEKAVVFVFCNMQAVKKFRTRCHGSDDPEHIALTREILVLSFASTAMYTYTYIYNIYFFNSNISV